MLSGQPVVAPSLGDPLLPAWLGREHTDVLSISLRDGFVDGVEYRGGLLDGGPRDGLAVGYDDEHEVGEGHAACGRALRALLQSPAADRLAHIRADAPLSAAGNDGCYGRHVDFLRDLLARDRPALQTLELDPWVLPSPGKPARSGGPPELSFLLGGFMHEAQLTVGDVSAIWSRAPNLSRLVLAQPKDTILGEVHATSLRTLVFGACGAGAIASIAAGRLDALETLLVRVASGADVRALLANTTLGRLRHLALIGNGSTVTTPATCDAVVEALLDSDVPERLETLDLGGFVPGDAACERLRSARGRFTSLRILRFSSWAPRAGAEDWWYGDTPTPFRGTSCSPHKRAAGKSLAEALPVTWLTVSGYADDAPARHHLGVFRDGHRDQDNFAERRASGPSKPAGQR